MGHVSRSPTSRRSPPPPDDPRASARRCTATSHPPPRRRERRAASHIGAVGGVRSATKRTERGASVDTEAREPELLRRIEALVAAAGDEEHERPEGPVLAAALTGLRAELGGLRADLGSLRAEIAAVRSGVEASVGRLAGDVSAAKSETASVAGRQEELGDQLDDITTGLNEI